MLLNGNLCIARHFDSVILRCLAVCVANDIKPELLCNIYWNELVTK
jgi:hypothetical protein